MRFTYYSFLNTYLYVYMNRKYSWETVPIHTFICTFDTFALFHTIRLYNLMYRTNKLSICHRNFSFK